MGNRVEGNFIGTDPSGTIDRSNRFHAIDIENGATTPAARNVLSGSSEANVV